jgi:hypothetical protein
MIRLGWVDIGSSLHARSSRLLKAGVESAMLANLGRLIPSMPSAISRGFLTLEACHNASTEFRREHLETAFPENYRWRDPEWFWLMRE